MSIGHNSQSSPYASLPVALQEMADVLGLRVVIALVEHFPGIELRIPHKLKDDHKLMVLGRDNAVALCEYCPEDTIHVPMSLDRKRLTREIENLSQQGLKRWQIAGKLGISQRHVRRLANKSPPDDGQFDLFIDSAN
jgi:hypothetical protein